MFRNKSVNLHEFAMVPRADIPRSSFRMQKAYKTTFDGGRLIPVFCEEILPGDTFNLKMTAFARLATPIFPVMDNIYIDSFFFFVPNRLVWDNWKKFMGEQVNPGDSVSYSIPQIVSATGGYAVTSLFDYFGLPTLGQIAGANTFSHSALPFRAYNLIFNEWFRDQNLINSLPVPKTDGPDLYTLYGVARRGKRHDYFTSCLPFLQKGNAVGVPITGTALVRTNSTPLITGSQTGVFFSTGATGATPANSVTLGTSSGTLSLGANATGAFSDTLYPNNLYADLNTGVNATINALRLSFQIQKLLERDARGGTRYTELVRAHFGVISPDARLQRPEYLGGGTSPINISPIAQTSATTVTGGDTPQGNLAAVGTATMHNHGFTQSFTEHGYVIGLVSVRADLTYQQGVRRHWSRLTKYDFYFPAFAMLGEQAVLNKEIYCDGSATDSQVFGYQERWAEYRYNQSEITGLFRSTAAGTIDPWHLAQKFTAVPTLSQAFIQEVPPLDRIIAVGTDANGQQLIADFFFDITAARPMPLYSVPGLVDHF